MLDEGDLTDGPEKTSPYHHVLTNGLGIQKDIAIKVNDLIVNSGEMYLLCTDGLTNCLTDHAIADILSTELQLKDKVEELIAAANDNGGQDNISVVLLQCEE